MTGPHGPQVPATETIAVVVVTFNSAPLLADLVTSLDQGLAGLQWHLTVVDNGSRDGSAAVARELAPQARVIETGRNGGYAAGINAGVTGSPEHTAVLILNPDVRLEPGCVAELVSALRTPGIGIAVPRLVDGDGRLIATMRREPTVLRALADALLGAQRAGYYPVLGEVVTDPQRYSAQTVTTWAEGSTVLVSAECFAATGSWDESFFLYSEETDFAMRAADAGFRALYVPSAHAIHLEGDSSTSPGLWALLTLNRVKFFRSRHGRGSTAMYWFALLLRESSRALLGKRTSRAAAFALVNPGRLTEARGPQSVRA